MSFNLSLRIIIFLLYKNKNSVFIVFIGLMNFIENSVMYISLKFWILEMWTPIKRSNSIFGFRAQVYMKSAPNTQEPKQLLPCVSIGQC